MNAIISISSAPAPGSPPKAKARLAAIGERLATLAAEFGQNVLADEKAWTLWLDEDDLDGLPDFFVASAARLAAERGEPGRYAVTLARSSIEPFLQFSGAPRPARDRLPRLGRARRERRRDRQPRRSPPRRCVCAPSAQNSSATKATPTTASPTRWPRRRAPRSIFSNRSGRPAPRPGAGRRRRCRRSSPSEGGNFQRRAVGLALARREAPQGRVRFRRERGEALSPARPDDRSRVLRGGPAVRLELHRALRRAALSSRRARLDGHRPRRRADRAFHRRLFRQALEAQRRLDEQFPRPAEARWAAICRSSST